MSNEQTNASESRADANRQSAVGNRQYLAWQGWRIELPARWNPVKIEGDYAAGAVMIADMHRPRLGLRWRTAPPRLDARKWARQAMLQEVGQLAADEAREHAIAGKPWQASTLYIEPEPPGRDVWLAFSPASNRCIEVVHHAHRRESLLADRVLPTVEDQSAAEPMRWSVFDLSCIAPEGMKLQSHRLNVGDLSLSFADEPRAVTIRQIAVAQLALKRMPLEKWLADQQRRRNRHYRALGRCESFSVVHREGRELKGCMDRMHRRRRFFFMRRLAKELVTAALHDPERDRIVIVEASDPVLLRECARQVGVT